MRITHLFSPLLVLGLAACATTARTDEEQAMATSLEARDIVPASTAQRDAIRSQDLLTQATFWAEVYDINPSDAEAALELSNVLRRMGNISRSGEVAQQALVQHPENPGLLLAFGSALAASGWGEHAIEPLQRAAQLDSNNWQIHNTLGVSFEQAGQDEAARHYFAEALRLSPAEPAVLSNLALSHALSGNPDMAENMLREAMIRPGADATIRQNLALVIALQGRFDEAEDMARIDVTPQMAEANMDYIRSMLTSQRRYDSVIAD